jgi:hypothetical protein
MLTASSRRPLWPVSYDAEHGFIVLYAPTTRVSVCASHVFVCVRVLAVLGQAGQSGGNRKRYIVALTFVFLPELKMCPERGNLALLRRKTVMVQRTVGPVVQ